MEDAVTAFRGEARSSAGSRPEPVYDSTISRRLVHRSNPSDVFLTEVLAVRRDKFTLGGYWPRRHHYYWPFEERPDMCLVGETLRQATIFVAHEFYGVPIGYRFLMDRLDLAAVSPRTRLGTAAGLTIAVDVDQVVTRAGRVTGLRSRVEIQSGGYTVGDGFGYLRVLDPRIYDRMRRPASCSGATSLPLSGHRVARERGVALESIGSVDDRLRRWRLIIDPDHPVFFDHVVDHVPGMLIIEAVRQAVRDLTGRRVLALTEFDARYSNFLELDGDVTLQTRAYESARTGVVASIEVAQASTVCVSVEAAAE